MSYFNVNHRCNGCLACLQNCPASALDAKDEGSKRTLLHNMTRCARCGTCWRVCPQDAIEFRHLLHNRWDTVVSLELIRCRICGEPVFTGNFGETLAEGVRQMAEPLCPRHRTRQASAVLVRGTVAKRKIKEGAAQ